MSGRTCGSHWRVSQYR